MFCVNDSLDRFNRTYIKIKESGLINEINSIQINCVGSNKLEYIQIINENFPKTVTYAGFNDANESETLNLARNFAIQNKNGNILYLHSKGVSNTVQEHLNRKKAVDIWVNNMELYLIENYKECLNYLKTYDTCGCFLRDWKMSSHYSGNFWWTTNSYLSTRPICEPNSKYFAEWFFLSPKFGKYKNLIPYTRNLYRL